MKLLDTIAELWDKLQSWMQWLFPAIVILLIIFVVANIKRGWGNFIFSVKEITSSKWWVFWFLIALAAFFIFWSEFKRSVGW